jgi:pimeloyl-ACP methyl ester carboxylesterase
MSSFAQNATIVLVHGAWADGSCCQKIILPMRTEGLKVTCAPIPLTSLTDDIDALQRVLERTSGPAILAGHAYGGAVIAGPNDDRVRSLVDVAALAPARGETVADVFIGPSRIPRRRSSNRMCTGLSGCQRNPRIANAIRALKYPRGCPEALKRHHHTRFGRVPSAAESRSALRESRERSTPSSTA